MKVHEKYSHTKSTILMMNPLPTVSKAYGLLLQEETHRNLSNIKTQFNLETAAFYARKFNDSKSQQQPSSIRIPGQSVDSGIGTTRNFVYTRNKLFCEHCKMRNHTKDKCYKLHGYPVDFKKSKRVAASVLMADSLENNEADDMVNMTVTQKQHK